MAKKIHFVLLGLGYIILFGLLATNVQVFAPHTLSAQTRVVAGVSTETPEKPPIQLKTNPESYVLPQTNFVSQSFNNCGPASLSMVMSILGKQVSQEELRQSMRPFSNPYGGVDDKSIFAEEFVYYAQQNGFEALARPNGDVELLKTFVAHDISVIVRTMLNDHEDIGHFRIVRGYDENRHILIQDDSYQGPNLEYSYEAFLKLWQPFNYGYIVVYPREKQEVVEAILGDEYNAQTAYINSIVRAEEELKNNPNSFYSQFNLSTAHFHVGNYEKSAQYFEESENSLPPRMLWYQLEPFLTYMKLGNYNRVLSMTERTISSGNMAYSELYYLRGKALEVQGNTDGAREQFNLAEYYNPNFLKVQESLRSL